MHTCMYQTWNKYLSLTIHNLSHSFSYPKVQSISHPDTNALCGYPIAKMEIKDSSQISTTAPIFLYYNYFRQNIWVNILVHFHFQYIFVDSTTNNIRFNSRPCSRCLRTIRLQKVWGTSWMPNKKPQFKYVTARSVLGRILANICIF